MTNSCICLRPPSEVATRAQHKSCHHDAPNLCTKCSKYRVSKKARVQRAQKKHMHACSSRGVYAHAMTKRPSTCIEVDKLEFFFANTNTPTKSLAENCHRPSRPKGQGLLPHGFPTLRGGEMENSAALQVCFREENLQGYNRLRKRTELSLAQQHCSPASHPSSWLLTPAGYIVDEPLRWAMKVFVGSRSPKRAEVRIEEQKRIFFPSKQYVARGR